MRRGGMSSSMHCSALAALGSASLLLRSAVPKARTLAPSQSPSGAARRAASGASGGWRPLRGTEVEAAMGGAAFGAELDVDLGTACANREGTVGQGDAALLQRTLRERRVVSVPGTVLDGAPAFERICRVFGDTLQPVNAKGDGVQLYMVQHVGSQAVRCLWSPGLFLTE